MSRIQVIVLTAFQTNISQLEYRQFYQIKEFVSGVDLSIFFLFGLRKNYYTDSNTAGIGKRFVYYLYLWLKIHRVI